MRSAAAERTTGSVVGGIAIISASYDMAYARCRCFRAAHGLTRRRKTFAGQSCSERRFDSLRV
jgi:hypothetical protein